MSKKPLTECGKKEYDDYIPIKCKNGHVLGLRRRDDGPVVVGKLYVRCHRCKAWYIISDQAKVQ